MGEEKKRIEIADLPDSVEAGVTPEDVQELPRDGADIKGGGRIRSVRYDGKRALRPLSGIRDLKRVGSITGDGGGTWKI